MSKELSGEILLCWKEIWAAYKYSCKVSAAERRKVRTEWNTGAQIRHFLVFSGSDDVACRYTAIRVSATGSWLWYLSNMNPINHCPPPATNVIKPTVVD